MQKGSLPSFLFYYRRIVFTILFGDGCRQQHGFGFVVTIPTRGGVAKWLCSGLQSRLRRFDPDPRLHLSKKSAVCAFFILRRFGFKLALSPSGEIGRHSGLKIRRLPEKGRTGSIPVSGTNSQFCNVRRCPETRMP
jgi:hypothetical protein